NYPSPRMVSLLETVDDGTLGVCLDVANSICAGEWPEETVGMLAPFAINLHLKDYVITPDVHGVGFAIHGVPLGQGRAPVGWILDQLAHCPPDMSVILEHWLPLNNDAAAARAQERPWLDQTVAAAKAALAGRRGENA
ncbi:MAG: sugar phosphate isomerase/epimerase, partial [Geminicoccaceae bacterium]|nr:sugar phosphate isomerase/epimerase [Geminicoccaceae bacterium]